MEREVESQTGATHDKKNPERLAQRDGYRSLDVLRQNAMSIPQKAKLPRDSVIGRNGEN
jgi:hypothetical protein